MGTPPSCRRKRRLFLLLMRQDVRLRSPSRSRAAVPVGSLMPLRRPAPAARRTSASRPRLQGGIEKHLLQHVLLRVAAAHARTSSPSTGRISATVVVMLPLPASATANRPSPSGAWMIGAGRHRPRCGGERHARRHGGFRGGGRPAERVWCAMSGCRWHGRCWRTGRGGMTTRWR